MRNPRPASKTSSPATSAICYLDGDRGVLAYCGYDIHDLAAARRPSRRSATCSGTAGCRPARSWATCSRSSRPRAPLPEPILRAHEVAAGRRRHGRAADADVGRSATTTRTQRTTSPQAQLPQGRPPHRAARHRSSPPAAALQAGGGPIEPGSRRSGHAANFLYMLTGDAADRARDAGLRRLARAARRPRAERLDVCGARGRRDAHRHALGDRRRHRRAQGPAARRRQRRGDEAAARDRRGRRPGARRGGHPRRSWRARRRFRASATACTTPRIRGRRTCAGCPRSSARRAGNPQWFEMSQRIEPVVKAREEAEPERRLLLGVDVLRARHPDRSLHADLRRQPHLRLDGARARAVREQPPDPARATDYIGPPYPQQFMPLDQR